MPVITVLVEHNGTHMASIKPTSSIRPGLARFSERANGRNECVGEGRASERAGSGGGCTSRVKTIELWSDGVDGTLCA